MKEEEKKQNFLNIPSENTTNLVGIGVKQEDFESIKSNDKEYTLLGKSHFGFTEIMKSKLNNKIYAIKKLHVKNEVYKEFIRETTFMLQLNHKNIVKLNGFFQGLENMEKIKDIYKDSKNKIYLNDKEDIKMYFLVLDYMPNGSLESYYLNLDKKGIAIKQDFIIKILKQILEGLIYLKKNNIICRNIKLDNILLDENNDIKITNFGLSAVYKDNNHKEEKSFLVSSCTQENSIKFEAPEIISHKKGMEYDFNYEVDIFSLGLSMLCLISKNFPISLISIGQKKQERKINQENINEIYDKYLINLIKRMILDEQKDRPTAEEALEELNKIEEYLINPNNHDLKNYLENKGEQLILLNPSLCNLIKIGMKQEDYETIKSDDKEYTLLGKGPFAYVEIMKSKLNNKIYAIKKIPVKKEVSKEFIRETTLMLQLNHINIVRLYGYFQGIEKIEKLKDIYIKMIKRKDIKMIQMIKKCIS